MIKRLHLGRAGESGILAARLAGAGYTGPETVLEGKFGFLEAYCRDGKPGLPADAASVGVSPGLLVDHFTGVIVRTCIACCQRTSQRNEQRTQDETVPPPCHEFPPSSGIAAKSDEVGWGRS
jgi:hypothetical protein